MIEKNKISTATKITSLLSFGREAVSKLLDQSMRLLHTDSYLPAEKHMIEIDDLKKFSVEELSTSPVGTMQLRWLLTNLVFSPASLPQTSAESEMFHNAIVKLIDMDPFLSMQDDFKKGNCVEHLDKIAEERLAWVNLKTAPAPVAPVNI